MAYTQYRSAVIIAKYYAGAYLNGTVSANNTPLQYVRADVLDKYNVQHDTVLTDENGDLAY
jgi:hypothetical protein